MKINNCLGKRNCWLLSFLFLFVGAIDAKAEIQLTDDLTLSGWLRHSMAFNIGPMNPYNSNNGRSDPAMFPPATYRRLQDDNNTLNLSRSVLQVELNYTPADILRFHTKMRLVSDQTPMWDKELYHYDPFPMPGGDRHGSLRTGDDEAIAEIWEIYGDLKYENMWLRMGKQVISWGEMVGVQIMDVINPLDQTWHRTYEIEEYENIKIPEWMIRGRYDVETEATWIEDLYLEGFLNPGDTSPGWNPEPGSPYYQNYVKTSDTTYSDPINGPLTPLESMKYDRRGECEWGLRFGGMLGQVGWTLNYLSLFDDNGQGDYSAPGPLGGKFTTKWERLDIYGTTLNYAFDQPFNLSATLEANYIPNQPYQDARAFEEYPAFHGHTWPSMGPPHIRETAESNWALMLISKQFLLPVGYDPLNITLQYAQKRVENSSDVKWFPGPVTDSSRVEHISRENYTLILKQTFWHQQIETEFKTTWFPEGAYQIKPRIGFKPGNHWRFDLYSMWQGGSAYSGDPVNGVWGNPNTFAYYNWVDEIYARIGYLF